MTSTRDTFLEKRNIITNLLRTYHSDHLFKWHSCWLPTFSCILFIVSLTLGGLPRRDIQAYPIGSTGFAWRDRWTQRLHEKRPKSVSTWSDDEHTHTIRESIYSNIFQIPIVFRDLKRYASAFLHMDVLKYRVQFVPYRRWLQSDPVALIEERPVVDDMRMTMTEVDQKEVKKEEVIDIDKRILAWSNISKISQTTLIPSRQERNFVQIPPTRFRKVLRVTSSTDTYMYQDDRFRSQDDVSHYSRRCSFYNLVRGRPRTGASLKSCIRQIFDFWGWMKTHRKIWYHKNMSHFSSTRMSSKFNQQQGIRISMSLPWSIMHPHSLFSVFGDCFLNLNIKVEF